MISKLCTAMCVLFALSAATLFAASGDTIRVRVPFAFIAGGKQMPAGTYVIEQTGEAGLFLFRGTSQAAVISPSFSPRVGSTSPGLVFKVAGNKSYLSSIEFNDRVANLMVQGR